MKLISALFSFLILAPSFASAAAASTRFTCGGMGPGTVFSVQFGGPRFADSVFVHRLNQDAKAFLLQSEQTLATSEEYLSMSLQVGTCEKVENSNVIVRCSLPAKSWAISQFGFTKNELLAPDFHQSSQISRNIDVTKLELEVVKVGTDAHLKLGMVVNTADKQDQLVSIDRKLATLNQDWYMCKFE